MRADHSPSSRHASSCRSMTPPPACSKPCARGLEGSGGADRALLRDVARGRRREEEERGGSVERAVAQRGARRVDGGLSYARRGIGAHWGERACQREALAGFPEVEGVG